MKFRKLACTVLAGAAILGLAACGNSGGSKDAGKSVMPVWMLLQKEKFIH